MLIEMSLLRFVCDICNKEIIVKQLPKNWWCKRGLEGTTHACECCIDKISDEYEKSKYKKSGQK